MSVPVNRIAKSGLLTLKLEDLVPRRDTVAFDLADYLWKGLALREKEFRLSLKQYDWAALDGKRLCVFCSADAIIPQYAYMLIGALAAPYVEELFIGKPEDADAAAFALAAATVDVEQYRDKRVVVKGCSDGRQVGAQAYATIARRLRGVVKSVMYGEPCSTVPVWKA